MFYTRTFVAYTLPRGIRRGIFSATPRHVFVTPSRALLASSPMFAHSALHKQLLGTSAVSAEVAAATWLAVAALLSECGPLLLSRMLSMSLHYTCMCEQTNRVLARAGEYQGHHL